MEALLRYSLFNIALFVLMLEIIVLVGFALVIFLIKYFSDRKKKSDEAAVETFSQAIMASLRGGKELRIPTESRGFKNGVVTLEHFDHRFTDPEWVRIRDKILDEHLLSQARKNVDNRSWIKRQLTARSFLLNPAKADDKDLAKLLDDPKFLVRVVAAACIVQKSNRKLFEAVIHKMVQETPLLRFSYRDALINADAQKFSWIEEMLKKEKDPQVCAVCLDLLSTRTTKDLFAITEPFAYSRDQQCRLLTIQILKSISSKESKDILINSLTDADWEVRAEAAKGLAQQQATQSSGNLQTLLSDPVWFVRLQAALALKSFGGEGLKTLSLQNRSKNPEAYEISQYVLALPE